MMSKDYVCDRCGGLHYKENLKPCILNSEKVYLCKDCRVQLGFEEYDTREPSEFEKYWNQQNNEGENDQNE